MFTGIIETVGKVVSVKQRGTNKIFTVASSVSQDLKIDQSVAHNGVCLTVVAVSEGAHEVVAIDETLKRTNLSSWTEGTPVNLERSLAANGRVDGHFVQGHVDTSIEVLEIEDKKGSWIYTFSLDKKDRVLVVEKGSIAINGVSLTIAGIKKKTFSVAIIPYTYEHTTFGSLEAGQQVNIEFDILGKYIERRVQLSTL